jgi:hypothetical protein
LVLQIDKLINKPLAKLTKRKRKKIKIHKIRDEKRTIIIDSIEVQEIIREYFENLTLNKLENLEGMDKFLYAYDLTIKPRKHTEHKHL